MNENLKAVCEQFVADRDAIKSVFKWENCYILPVGALILNGKADTEKLKLCKTIIEKNTGVFSGFAGNARMPAAVKLAVAENPEEKFAEILEIYNIRKKYFGNSGYLAYISTVLADMIPASEADKLGERGKHIYKLMSKKHPFLTGGEDSPFALLFAFSEKSDEELIADMEDYYTAVKKYSYDGNSAQSISHIFALENGDKDTRVQRFEDLFAAIESRGRKYSKYYELCVLAALSMLPVDIEKAADDIIEADKFLSEQEGYGFFGYDKKTRLMHASMLVMNSYSSSAAETAAVTTTLAMVAAQQAAMCAIIAASSASTAAATSN